MIIELPLPLENKRTHYKRLRENLLQQLEQLDTLEEQNEKEILEFNSKVMTLDRTPYEAVTFPVFLCA